MKKRVIKYLACAVCKSKLTLEESRSWKNDIRSGKLVCSNCKLAYPIVNGFPFLITSETISEWKSPVSEAMGISRYETYEDSIDTLNKIGIKNAVKITHNLRSQKPRESSSMCAKSIKTIPSKILNKIKYRESGEWFKYGIRTERLLTFPWKNNISVCSFTAFMQEIKRTQPEVLLDIASGGGFGVSQQLWLNSVIKQTIAIERDLKCLGNIQYRFKHIKKAENSIAVAGDVRQLPIQKESIDTAMMLVALPEIYRITALLKEVYRVLKPKGSYVLLIPESAYTSEKINKDDFIRFAKEVDLYAGYKKFLFDAENTGFKIKLAKQFKEKNGKYKKLISLIKQ